MDTGYRARYKYNVFFCFYRVAGIVEVIAFDLTNDDIYNIYNWKETSIQNERHETERDSNNGEWEWPPSDLWLGGRVKVLRVLLFLRPGEKRDLCCTGLTRL